MVDGRDGRSIFFGEILPKIVGNGSDTGNHSGWGGLRTEELLL